MKKSSRSRKSLIFQLAYDISVPILEKYWVNSGIMHKNFKFEFKFGLLVLHLSIKKLLGGILVKVISCLYILSLHV